ncbi:MAG: sulfotransferase [Solirubrobacterales bacterium]|nr:sulfotransferase [Solirubrobacterales bacterium]
MADLGPYDESVPHPAPRAELARRFADLRARRAERARPVDLGAVRELIVVVTSSRGGSSLLGELLRRHAGLLHFPAELNPYVAIAQLDRERDRRQVLADELALAIGQPEAHPGPGYADEVAWRLLAQWPDLELGDAARFVGDRTDGLGAQPGLSVIAAVRAEHPEVELSRYDVPGAGLGDRVLKAAGPTAETVIEMTPFVLPRPWQRATPAEVALLPLLLSTPRMTYRLPLVRALFPNARIRLLHLTRNPAGATNGLIDGWLSSGFFSTPVPTPLNISGYSDRFPEWGTRWWCYEVPPDWASLTDRPLAEVCAAQWRSAHTTAFELPEERLRIAYEDLVGPDEQRQALAERLAAWIGLDPGPLAELLVRGLPPVMATRAPRPGRWREREDELLPVLIDDETLALAERLGHPPDPSQWG